MAGFKKCGIFPLNPSQITDRQLMPSVGVKPKQKDVDPSAEKERPVSNASGPLFSQEKEVLYQKRFEEGYNVRDPDYIAWVKINHPTSNLCSLYAESSTSSSKSLTVSSKGATNHPTSEPSGLQTESSTSSSKSPTVTAPGSKGATSNLSDILILPKPKSPETKRKPKKPSLNKKTICITDNAVYDSMKLEAAEKEAEKEKERKANEKAEKKKAKKNEAKEAARRKPKKSDSKEGGGKIQEEDETVPRRKPKKSNSKGGGKDQEDEETVLRRKPKKSSSKGGGKDQEENETVPRRKLKKSSSKGDQEDETVPNGNLKNSSKAAVKGDQTVCPKCGYIYEESDDLWVCCDGCDAWYDKKCTSIRGKRLPKRFYCDKCES